MMNGSLASLLSSMKAWAYPASLIIGLVFWFGVWYGNMSDLKAQVAQVDARMDRIEAKLDQLMGLKK